MRWNVLGKALLGIVLLLALTITVGAAGIRGGENVVIEADQVIDDDLIVSGQTVLVKGVIKGDLVAFGGTVTLAAGGVVEGDALLAGQVVVIEGEIGDDARVGGMGVMLGREAIVGDDFIAAGFAVEAQPGSQVDGDALVGGQGVTLAGQVAQDVYASAEGVALDGTVGGDARVFVGKTAQPLPYSPLQNVPNAPQFRAVSGGLAVADGARIGGKLEYTSAEELAIPASVAVGGVTRLAPLSSETEKTEQSKPVADLLNGLRGFAALLINGLLLIWLAPKLLHRGADQVRAKPWPALGWGAVAYFGSFAVMIAWVALIVILAMILSLLQITPLVGLTIGGGVAGLLALVLAFAIATAYVAKIILAVLGGRWLLEQLKSPWAEHPVWPMVVGVVIVTLLTALPLAGGLINWVMILFGLGALWLLARTALRKSDEA